MHKRLTYWTAPGMYRYNITSSPKYRYDFMANPNTVSFFVSDIMGIVSNYTGITIDEIESKSRKRELVMARFFCFKLIHKHSNLTLTVIGRKVGRRDHSTVIYGIRSIEDIIETDPKIKKQFNELETLVHIKLLIKSKKNGTNTRTNQ